MRRDKGGAEAEPQEAEEAGPVPGEEDAGAEEAVERGVELGVLEVVLLHQHEEPLQGHQAREPALGVAGGEEVGELRSSLGWLLLLLLLAREGVGVCVCIIEKKSHHSLTHLQGVGHGIQHVPGRKLRRAAEQRRGELQLLQAGDPGLPQRLAVRRKLRHQRHR